MHKVTDKNVFFIFFSSSADRKFVIKSKTCPCLGSSFKSFELILFCAYNFRIYFFKDDVGVINQFWTI